MSKLLRCSDLGTGCPKEIRAENEEELLKLAAEHAEKIMESALPAFLPECFRWSKPPSRTNSNTPRHPHRAALPVWTASAKHRQNLATRETARTLET